MPLLNRNSRGFGKNTNSQVTDVNASYNSLVIPGSELNAFSDSGGGRSFSFDGGGIVNSTTTRGPVRPSRKHPFNSALNWSYFFSSINNSYFTMPNTGNTLEWNDVDGVWTAEAWVYLSQYNASQPINIIGRRNFFGTTFSGIDWGFGVNTSGFLYFVWGTSGVQLQTYTGTKVVPLFQWNHVACVLRTVGGSLWNGTLYLNGANTSSAGFQVSTIGSFGGNPYNVGAAGSQYLKDSYISNLRIVKGSNVYVGENFTPPTAPLGNVTGTVLLTCQGNRIADVSTSNLAITLFGNVTVSTTAPTNVSRDYYDYNLEFSENGSLYFPTGVNQEYVTYIQKGIHRIDFRQRNFTIESWIYMTGRTGFIRGIANTWNGGGLFALRVTAANVLEFSYNNADSGISTVTITGNTQLFLGQWYHVAVVRNSGTITMYVNGVAQNSTSAVGNGLVTYYNGVTRSIYIGIDSDQTGSTSFCGYISNFRIVQGQALYTQPFSEISNKPSPPIPGVFCVGQYRRPANNQTLIDGSIFENTIETVLDTFQAGSPNYRAKRIATGSFSPYGDDWSTYFSGNDALILEPTIQFQYGLMHLKNVTMDFWFNSQATDLERRGIISSAITNAGATQGWEITLTNGYLNIAAGTSGTQWANAYANTQVQPGTWNFVRILKDTTNTWTLYLNGANVLSTSTGAGNNLNISNPLRVGMSRDYTTGVAKGFIGYLGGVRLVMDTLLPSNEIPKLNPTSYIGVNSLSGSSFPANGGSFFTSNTTLILCSSRKHEDTSVFKANLAILGYPKITKFAPPYTGMVIPKTYSYKFSSDNALEIAANAHYILGRNPMTWEWWMYNSANVGAGAGAGTRSVILGSNSSATFKDFSMWIDQSGRLALADVSGALNVFGTVDVANIWNNNWTHVAVVKSNQDNWNVYLNGSNVFGTTYSKEWANTPRAPISIGKGVLNDGPFNGYLSNFRITKSALYQSNFTPTLEPLQTTGDTILLTCQDPVVSIKTDYPFDLNPTFSGTSIGGPSSFNPLGYRVINAKGYDANVFGGSASFPGRLGFAVVKEGPHQRFSNSFTMQGWFYAEQSNVRLGFGNVVIVSKGAPGTGWELGIGTGNTLVFTNNVASLVSTTRVRYNEWNHFALSRDSSALTKLFLNGNLESTNRLYYNFANESANIIIGGGRNNFTGTPIANTFTGYIAGLQIDANVVLYANNFVPPLFANKPTANTVFYLECVPGIVDYTGGTNIETNWIENFWGPGSTDSSDPCANTYTQTLPIEENYWDDRQLSLVNKAVYFKTGDYLTLNNPSNFVQDREFTVEMWICPISRPASFDAKIWLPSQSGSGSNRLAIGLDTAGKIVVDNQQTGNIITSSLALNNGQWYHIALVRSGNLVSLYINGSLSNGGTASHSSWQTTGDTVVIGYRPDVSTYYNGYIADLRYIRGTPNVYMSLGGSYNTFSIPTRPISSVANTTLLLFQGSNLYANGAVSSLIDRTTGNANTLITITGTPLGEQPFSPYKIISPANQPNVSISALYFDGLQVLRMGPNIPQLIFANTIPFTIEAAIRPIVDNATLNLFTLGTELPNRFNIAMVNGYVNTNMYGAASANLGFPKIQPNVWTHLAYVRNANIGTLYINGIQNSTLNYNAGNIVGTGTLQIGIDGAQTDTAGFRGWMKDIRFTNGIARYTSNTTGLAAWTTGNVIYLSNALVTRPIIPVNNITKPLSGIPLVTLKPNVDYVMVGGGGAGGTNAGSGGGGGGLLQGAFTYVPGITYSIVIGAGGAIATSASDTVNGSNGSNTSLFGYTVLGGGAGGSGATRGFSGGSGGGTPSEAPIFTAAPGRYTGNVFLRQQGYPGGFATAPAAGTGRTTGGGGGAGEAGKNGDLAGTLAANGGAGLSTFITGSNVFFAGGGAGGSHQTRDKTQGGLGGGGAAGKGGPNSSFQTTGFDANINTGGGGGGGGGGGAAPTGLGGAGGSGIVILRHPAAIKTAVTTGSNVLVTRTSSNVVYQFYSSGTIRFDNSELFTINPTTLPFPAPANASGVGNGGTPTNYPAFLPGGSTPTPSPSPSPSPAPVGLSSVSYLMVAGGGGSGYNAGSGGGGGGSLFSTTPITLNTPYTVTVGGGGTGGPGNDAQAGTNGSNTTVFGLIAVGGGAGGGGTNIGTNGGSGSGTPGPEAGPEGATARLGYGYPGTAGTTQQGFPGGIGSGSGASRGAGGGGGGGGFGLSPSPTISGGGGPGANSSISGSLLSYGGGGGGGTHQGITGGYGGPGGGGRGGSPSPTISTQGQTNSGGGGGGGSGFGGSSTNGGSGIVIITHPTAFTQASTTGSNVTYSVVNTERVYTFYSSGDITFL